MSSENKENLAETQERNDCWLVEGQPCKKNVSGLNSQRLRICKECEVHQKRNHKAIETFFSFNDADVFGISNLGLIKKKNEDRFLIKQLKDKSILFAVADGLGDDMSSDFAAEIVRQRLNKIIGFKSFQIKEELCRIVKELDRFVCEKSNEFNWFDGMATTLVCAVLVKNQLHWINVGDSRLYVLRANELLQITEDQTLARFLVKEGEITQEQAKEHYSNRIVDQCIGYGECEPDTGSISIKSGDRLIFATDGLSKTVSSKIVSSILSEFADIRKGSKELVKAALESGGDDNITIIVAKIK